MLFLLPVAVKVAQSSASDRMLSAKYRMRSSDDFARTIQGGKKRHTSTVTVYAYSYPSHIGADLTAKVGFVVSKKVGNSVVRHRVVRQLRRIIQPIVPQINDSTLIVVRAKPRAASVSFAELSRDVRTACEKLEVFQSENEAHA